MEEIRKIKFRAIMKNKNATVHFTLQDLVNPKALFSIRELLIPWLLEGNQPDRWIGLRDKNGKNEIYEGDIVEFKEVEIDSGKFSGKTKIWFRHGCFVLDKVGNYPPFARDGKAGLGFYTPSLYDIDEQKLEVIGNIYENPELVKEKK